MLAAGSINMIGIAWRIRSERKRRPAERRGVVASRPANDRAHKVERHAVPSLPGRHVEPGTDPRVGSTLATD